jgi:hypothetical protein
MRAATAGRTLRRTSGVRGWARRRSLGERARDGELEALGAARLGQRVRRADAPGDRRQVHVAGEQHDRDVLLPAVLHQHAVRHPRPVEDRHVDVEDHDVGQAGGEREHAGLAVVRGAHLMPLAREELLQELREIHVVVDDQELRHAASPPGARVYLPPP